MYAELRIPLLLKEIYNTNSQLVEHKKKWAFKSCSLCLMDAVIKLLKRILWTFLLTMWRIVYHKIERQFGSCGRYKIITVFQMFDIMVEQVGELKW